ISMPLFLFSATFYPLGVYPRAIQVIIECTPLYQGVVLLRGLTLGVVGPDLLWRAAYPAPLGLIGLFLAGPPAAKLVLLRPVAAGRGRRSRSRRGRAYCRVGTLDAIANPMAAAHRKVVLHGLRL